MSQAATGKLIAIQLRPSRGAPIVQAKRAELVSGKGIMGDRQSEREEAKPRDQQRRQVSLIAIEEVQAFDQYCQAELDRQFNAEMSRRNLVTQGIHLNDLVGKTFKVGEVTFLGIELCQPCNYLQEILDLPFRKHMTNKSGIRAEILESGQVQLGDEVACWQAEASA